jgi:hypothetical protein
LDRDVGASAYRGARFGHSFGAGPETPVMARPRKPHRENRAAGDALPDDLHDYARPPPARPAPEDPARWTVKDDWPDYAPVTEAEIEVFEAWFGDLFDELFSTRH